MQSICEVSRGNPRVLWLEVVATAMRDTLPESKPRIRDEATYWLLHSKDFHVICEMAGLDSAYLRNMIAASFRRASCAISPSVPSQPFEQTPAVEPELDS